MGDEITSLSLQLWTPLSKSSFRGHTGPTLQKMSDPQPPPSSPTRTTTRLNQIKNHTMGSARPATVFTADVVPQAAEDPLFGLMTAYKKDSSDKKVDLGIGAYRDDNAKPWVLPVVKKVCRDDSG